MRGSAPGERRGGRKAGTPNKRTALLRDRLSAEGIEPADELVKIARAAEDRDDLDLAADCWSRLAAYIYPKPRPVVLDPDELVALEARLAETRAKAAVKEMTGFGDLADRLLRAEARNNLTETDHAELARLRSMVGNGALVTGVPRAPDEPVTIDAVPASLPVIADATTTPTPTEAAPVSPPAPPADWTPPPKPHAEPYSPVLPYPPEAGFVLCDYSLFGDGLLAGRNR